MHPPNPASLVNGHATRNTTLPRQNQAAGRIQHMPNNLVKPVQLVIIEKDADRNNPANEKVVTYIPGEHHIQVEREATRAMLGDTTDCEPNAGVKIPYRMGEKNGHPVRAPLDSPEIEITCAPTRLKDDPDVRPKVMTDYRPPPYSAVTGPSQGPIPGFSQGLTNENTTLRPVVKSVGSVRVTQAPTTWAMNYNPSSEPVVTSVASKPVYAARVTELPSGGSTGSLSSLPAHPVPVYGGRYHPVGPVPARVEQVVARPPPAPHSHSRAPSNSIPPVRGPGMRYLGGSSRVFRPIHNPGASPTAKGTTGSGLSSGPAKPPYGAPG